MILLGGTVSSNLWHHKKLSTSIIAEISWEQFTLQNESISWTKVLAIAWSQTLNRKTNRAHAHDCILIFWADVLAYMKNHPFRLQFPIWSASKLEYLLWYYSNEVINMFVEDFCRITLARDCFQKVCCKKCFWMGIQGEIIRILCEYLSTVSSKSLIVKKIALRGVLPRFSFEIFDVYLNMERTPFNVQFVSTW